MSRLKDGHIPPKSKKNFLTLEYQPLFTKHWNFLFLNLPAPIHYCSLHVFIGVSHHPIYNKLQHQKQKLHLFLSVNGQLNQHYQCIDLQSNLIQSEPETTFILSQLFNLFQIQQQINLNKNDKDLIFDLFLNLKPKNYAFLSSNFFSKQDVTHVNFEGTIQYRNETISLERFGYLFSNKFLQQPFLKIYFYMRMVIEIDGLCICFQQHQYNRNLITNRKVIICKTKKNKGRIYTSEISYNLYSVFPRIELSDKKSLFIPKEHEWQLKSKQYQIEVRAKSRKDFKFGFANGVIDSFTADITINQKTYSEKAIGYMEYIDSRSFILSENKLDNMQEILTGNLKPSYSAVKTFKLIEKTRISYVFYSIGK
ncbi:hypothetical protein [Acinetobacter nectaris]|uniref:hypothetical protein n=1 Tax=Acinetobacter nectaris TaxID=1219382 RepID=UPI001F3D2EDA|nr:hypothetical protein [Acinetobacter nectaris]MCF9034558.1 hypothetical protein [Acinetobacter nectaris]